MTAVAKGHDMAATKDAATRIMISELCSKCWGDGCYYSSQWAEWNRIWNETERQAQQEQKATIGIALGTERSWVMDRVEKILKERGVEQPEGPEEPPCPECEGKGRCEKSVTIAEFAALIDPRNDTGSALQLRIAIIKVLPDLAQLEDLCSSSTMIRDLATKIYKTLSNAIQADVERLAAGDHGLTKSGKLREIG